MPVAPLMRQCVTGLLGIYFFGKTLCKLAFTLFVPRNLCDSTR